MHQINTDTFYGQSWSQGQNIAVAAKPRPLYTGGTFDLFHAGHVNFLKQCKRLIGNDGDVIVSLNTDEFIEEYKGKPPVCTYEQRKAVLDACRYVDLVVPNTGGADSKPAIEDVLPSIIAIGDDWAKKDYYAQMQFTQEWLDEKGILLVYLPYTQGISTTKIKEASSERYSRLMYPQ